MTLDKEAYNIRVHEGGQAYGKDWQDHYPSIIKLVPSNSYVLDVGCGRGGLLKYLRDKKNCTVIGLDITSDSVRFCKEKGIDVIKCDLEEEEIPGTYDVIIFSAVLEHLIDPLWVLEKFRNNLKAEGCIIIGVPNFSHILARIQYLRGKNVQAFGSAKEDLKLGVQPYPHIRFFNKATLSLILHKMGYKPVRWSYYKSQSFSVDPKSYLHKKVISWIFYKFYQIDHELFSGFIAVKAKKVKEVER